MIFKVIIKINKLKIIEFLYNKIKMLKNDSEINNLFEKNLDEYEENNNLYIGGYDENLVINKNYLLSLDNIYKCNICNKIMINPVECEKCGHNFCFNCLNSSDCPFGCKDKIIKHSSLAIKNLLSQLRFKCPNIGCTISFEYTKIEKHNRECPYKEIKCPNKKCEKILIRKDFLNHIKNECEYTLINCKYCKYEFIKKEIEHHENICKLLNKEKDSINYDNNKIGLDEHLKRLSKNINEIIKNNQNLIEKQNDKDNDKNQNNNGQNRISIRKSIVPGLEGDVFLDIIKKEIESKIRNYYNEFNENFIKIIKEIDDIKEMLKHYINNIIIDNNFNKNPDNNNIIEKNEYNKNRENEEEIKKYVNELLIKTENNLKNAINSYKEIFSNFNVLFNDDKNNNLEKNKIIENININKDIYCIINNIVNNLKDYIFEANNQIKNFSNNFNNDLNNLIKDKIEKNEKILNEKVIKELLNELKTKIGSKGNIINKNTEDKKEIVKNDEDLNKEINEKKNIENEIVSQKIQNKDNKNEINCLNIQVEETNNSLINIKNNIKQVINLINEKFTDFSELIKNNDKDSNDIEKTTKKYTIVEICHISSFTLYDVKIDNNKEKNQTLDIRDNNNVGSFKTAKFGCIPNVNDNPLLSLNNLETRLSSLEKNSENFSIKIKEKIKSELSQKLSEINTQIENDIDRKIEKIFSLKYCKECEKIDYFYGFIKCTLCNEDNCKQCIVICTNCKNFCCLKCCLCRKCDKLICNNCRILCISCHNKYCQLCIMNCPSCNKNICSNCLIQCSLCNKINCNKNCSQTCYICLKNYCKNCSKNIKFFKCNICNNNICENCFSECKEHNKIICKHCCEKCEDCKYSFCNKFIIKCNECKNTYCIKCCKNFEENKSCKLCKNTYCNKCSIKNKNIQCISCLRQICNKCSLKCCFCSSILCKECFITCKCCNNSTCAKCMSECICEKEKFCNKCIQTTETLLPHECVYFLNNSSITKSKKTRTVKYISNNVNIEAKFNVFMNDLSDKSFLLVGLTDNNTFNENDLNEVRNIFAVNINNGDKYSSENGFEDFLDFENINKGFNDVYVMIKEHKLFFKINDSIYKWAYELKNNKNYWFYIENNILNSTSKFIYLRKIK